jgi:tellurite resistance protein TerC
LRSVDKLWALKYGITIVLLFIGIKMILPAVQYINSAWHLEVPTLISLLVVLGLLVGSVILSFVMKKPSTK